MKQFCKTIVYLSCLLVGFNLTAQTNEEVDSPYPDYQEDVFMDMEFNDNLLTPEVPQDAQKAVTAYIKKVAKKLKDHYTVDLNRNEDVFILVIPTDDLFLPNDTLFSSDATRVLTPVLDLMKDPYMYKVVLALHTDDTGSEGYRMSLSTARINSVYEWLMDAVDRGTLSEDVIIIPYAMGSNEPLKPNDTRKNRKENRRLEFYFIPGPKMIEMAQEKKLK